MKTVASRSKSTIWVLAPRCHGESTAWPHKCRTNNMNCPFCNLFLLPRRAVGLEATQKITRCPFPSPPLTGTIYRYKQCTLVGSRLGIPFAIGEPLIIESLPASGLQLSPSRLFMHSRWRIQPFFSQIWRISRFFIFRTQFFTFPFSAFTWWSINPLV